MKRFIVNWLEAHCLHHPWWYLGYMPCGMARLSYKLDKYWNIGEWKKPDWKKRDEEEAREEDRSSTG